jgi:putative transposase
MSPLGRWGMFARRQALSRSCRKNLPPFDKLSYKGRNVIERAFSHLKDWRRVATRYDKLARNYRATVTLAIILKWWIN